MKSPIDGGCWFCLKDDGEMLFSTEFDCWFHEKCCKTCLENGDKEAEIIAQEFGWEARMVPSQHFLISMVKSGVRVAGVILALVLRDWWVLAVFFGIAEIIGVFEEVVDG